MAVPKKRHTKGRRNRRRMHLFIERPNLISCPKCGKARRPHTVCPNCGYYRGREVINVLGRLTKEERKKKEKEMATRKRASNEPEKPLTLEELSKK